MFCCDDCNWVERDHDEEHDCEECGCERCFECAAVDPKLCKSCREEAAQSALADEALK